MPNVNIPEIPQPSEQSMKSELDMIMGKIKEKKNSIDSMASTNSFSEEELKKKLINQLFEVLIEAGVDPNDPASISNFLRELEAQNPDLFALFEEAFNGLTGFDSGMVSGQQPMHQMPDGTMMPGATHDETVEPGLMQKFGNLAQDKMMPRQ